VDLASSGESQCLDGGRIKLSWILGTRYIRSQHQFWFCCRPGFAIRCLTQKRNGKIDFSTERARLTENQYLMVDVVTNHMGYAGCGECVDYSIFNPFDKESYYHPFCLIDYNNQTSMELVGNTTAYCETLLT
jgi:hypothetical protein